MTTWVRSSRCVGGDCLEARRVGEVVLVRDSKLGDLALQAWSREEWTSLLIAVDGGYPHVAVDHVSDDQVALGLDRHDKLAFTAEQWNAFEEGVLAGEFDLDKLASLGSSTATDGSEAAGEVDRPLSSSAAPQSGPPPVKLLTHGARCDQDPSASGESYLPGAALSDSPAGPSTRTLDTASGCANPSDAGRPGTPPDWSLNAVWRSLSLALARFGYVEWGDPPGMPLAEAFVEALADHGYRVVDALKWGSGALVQHVPDDSRPTGVAGGELAEGGAAVASAGEGEVVPGAAGVPQASPSGTTEPDSRSSSLAADSDGAAAVRTAEEAGPVVHSAGPADGDVLVWSSPSPGGYEAAFVPNGECGWLRVDLGDGRAER